MSTHLQISTNRCTYNVLRSINVTDFRDIYKDGDGLVAPKYVQLGDGPLLALWGDEVHDDSRALQCLVDGGEVVMERVNK